MVRFSSIGLEGKERENVQTGARPRRRAHSRREKAPSYAHWMAVLCPGHPI